MVVGSIYFFLGMCMIQVVEYSRYEYLKARESHYAEIKEEDTEASV